MLSKLSKYWWCQICGWGVFALVNIFFAYTYDKTISERLIARLFIALSLGIPITHWMRGVIIKQKWLTLSIEKMAPRLFLIIIIGSFLYALSQLSLFGLFHLSETDGKKQVSFLNNVVLRTLDSSVILMVWVLIYYLYHSFQKNKNQEVDTFRLQSLVKELELKTIKSHINPHFIFNSLNSIRALVDENPQRARQGITELSNILRNSMQTEKMETVPLNQELDIVKDYLALEQMRFEERLKVEFDIEKNTLQQPIPPMMLQTLVENAVKHGISKQLSGGTITVLSRLANNSHEIIIRNSGVLSDYHERTGFGLQSTVDRLNLLFGTSASFEIRNIPGEMVEAKVIIPLTNGSLK